MQSSQKKGQAAIEYLMTYGWAVVIILVVIGALLYFGVLNPNRFLPDSCDFGQQFRCIEAQVSRDGYVVLSVQNDYGDHILITDTTSFDTNILGPHPFSDEIRLAEGNQYTFAFPTSGVRETGTFPPNEKVGIYLKFFFKRDLPDSETFTASGRIFTTVCDGDYNPAQGEVNNC